jgi:hypothetical protein
MGRGGAGTGRSLGPDSDRILNEQCIRKGTFAGVFYRSIYGPTVRRFAWLALEHPGSAGTHPRAPMTEMHQLQGFRSADEETRGAGPRLERFDGQYAACNPPIWGESSTELRPGSSDPGREIRRKPRVSWPFRRSRKADTSHSGCQKPSLIDTPSISTIACRLRPLIFLPAS